MRFGLTCKEDRSRDWDKTWCEPFEGMTTSTKEREVEGDRQLTYNKYDRWRKIGGKGKRICGTNIRFLIVFDKRKRMFIVYDISWNENFPICLKTFISLVVQIVSQECIRGRLKLNLCVDCRAWDWDNKCN